MPLKFVESGADVGILWRGCWRSSTGTRTAGGQALNLADREAAPRGAQRVARTKVRIRDSEECTAVASAEFSLFNPFLNGRFKLEQPNSIGDRGAVLAGALRDDFLRQLKFFH